MRIARTARSLATRAFAGIGTDRRTGREASWCQAVCSVSRWRWTVSDHGTGSESAIPTVIVDRLGAGDAFMAGVIDGLLADDMERGVKTGTVLASLALGTRGDHVITTRDEVERFLGSGGRAVDR